MLIQKTNIRPGVIFTNGLSCVRVAVNRGLRAGLRLDHVPSTGLVYAPWFQAEQDVAEFLNRGGHVGGKPFQPAVK
jgi:hypothetical protein